MGEKEENNDEDEKEEGEAEDEKEEEEDEDLKGRAYRYLKDFMREEEDDDEPKLQIIVSCAELAGIFDPLHDVQLPYVEVYCDDEEIGETQVACGFDGHATLEASLKPVWNRRFVFRADGTKFYRFKVCIHHDIRNRTVVGEAGFTAADAWRAAGKHKGPVVLNVQLLRREELSGILHLVLGKFQPGTDLRAARAAKKSIQYYERQDGQVDRQWDVEWMMLPPSARTDFMILGWNRERWYHNRPPESEYTCWKELTYEERFAAERLGYDIFQWDGFENIEIAAANYAASQYFWYDWQPDDLIKLSKGSSLHRAHPYIGSSTHDRFNGPPLYDVHPEDPTHQHHQPEWQRGFEEKDYVKEKEEVQEDKYDEEDDDHEAHLYMWNDIFDHVMIGQSHDDEPVPDDDIVHLPIVYRGAPEETPEPIMPATVTYAQPAVSQVLPAEPYMPATVTYVQPAVSQVLPAPLVPTTMQVSPEPYVSSTFTYVQSSGPKVLPASYTPTTITEVPLGSYNMLPNTSLGSYNMLPKTSLGSYNMLPTYRPASPTQTETYLQPPKTFQIENSSSGYPVVPMSLVPVSTPVMTPAPVPSTLLAQAPLQLDPRSVGTANLSNNAPPKVLTSLSRIPQEVVDYSVGSIGSVAL